MPSASRLLNRPLLLPHFARALQADLVELHLGLAAVVDEVDLIALLGLLRNHLGERLCKSQGADAVVPEAILGEDRLAPGAGLALRGVRRAQESHVRDLRGPF